MIAKNGDARLIDFNIALNLQEKDAVFAQLSESYASPEHYGSEDPTMRIEVLQDTDGAEETPTKRFRISDSEKMVRLDARSDIYNLGATLYHLLSGERPAKDAQDVKPLSKEFASPGVSAILQKAMAPDPADRYQTAREMLNAFQRLPASDPKARLRRWLGIAVSAAVLLLAITGLSMIFIGQYQITRLRETALCPRCKAGTSPARCNTPLTRRSPVRWTRPVRRRRGGLWPRFWAFTICRPAMCRTCPFRLWKGNP